MKCFIRCRQNVSQLTHVQLICIKVWILLKPTKWWALQVLQKKRKHFFTPLYDKLLSTRVHTNVFWNLLLGTGTEIETKLIRHSSRDNYFFSDYLRPINPYIWHEFRDCQYLWVLLYRFSLSFFRFDESSCLSSSNVLNLLTDDVCCRCHFHCHQRP